MPDEQNAMRDPDPVPWTRSQSKRLDRIMAGVAVVAVTLLLIDGVISIAGADYSPPPLVYGLGLAALVSGQYAAQAAGRTRPIAVTAIAFAAAGLAVGAWLLLGVTMPSTMGIVLTVVAMALAAGGAILAIGALRRGRAT